MVVDVGVAVIVVDVCSLLFIDLIIIYLIAQNYNPTEITNDG